MGLDPLKPGQVHFIKYGTSPGSIVVGIEGFRARAARTKQLAGIKRGVLRDAQGKCVGGWCEVYRHDWTHPAREEVSLTEYDTKKNQWSKMPETMIKKVAEAAALRMAFPDELGGTYAEEEMHQVTRDVRAQELNSGLNGGDLEVESAPAFQAADYFINPEPTVSDDLGEYEVKVGKKYKGKKLKDIPGDEIAEFVAWVGKQASPHASVVECAEKMSQYLEMERFA
jgi:hypothetical protein